MNWLQLFLKRNVSPVVPALGAGFERATELTGTQQSLGDGVEIGLPELNISK